jgi:pimeloyl-ACP methyl ester carboxylesterase
VSAPQPLAGGVRHRSLALPHGITLQAHAVGPDPHPGFETATATATAGPPRVLLLHGFPEGAFAWDGVLAALAAARPDVAAVAPSLRGFAGSSAPADPAAYRPRALVGDLVALIEALGAPLDLLVAHDWGGALAWTLAAQRPDLLRRLLVINAPHSGTFLRELRGNPAQQQASAYMNWLCRPDAAARLAENDFARLWAFFEPAPWLTPARREVYRQAWRAGLQGPLNWYRGSPLRPPVPGDAASAAALHALVLPEAMLTVRVPTTVLWGERDRALLPALLDGLQHWVPALAVQRVPEGSHWLVHEQPQTVVREILRLL